MSPRPRANAPVGPMLDDLRREDRGDIVWRPEAPPVLDSRVTEVELDTETTGLRWWEADRPIGIALRLPSGRTQYLPWGHKGGGNLDEAVVREWARRELRGKRITNLNTRFDIHMLRAWGIDLEAQGCTVSDVAHDAALLDDHRQSMSLNSIAEDYLGEQKHTGLDKTRMADYHAGEVAAYACQDVHLVGLLKEKFRPMIEAEGLTRVKALEDRVIYPVCEMERNGVPINVPLLEQWRAQSKREYEKTLFDLYRETGIMVNPNSPRDLKKLWVKLGLPVTYLPTGSPTFTGKILKACPHPIGKTILRAVKLDDIRSLLDKIYNVLSPDGILRYALHQLRAKKDENADYSGEAGTVSGRFSSTEICKDDRGRVGVNIQQIPKVSKQRTTFGFDEKDSSHDDDIYLIRRLMIPGSGKWLSADAKQIEYRLFASYANNPTVIQAYKDNPDLSFHEYMAERLKPFKPDLTYKDAKDTNFAKIYGAKVIKLALMMGHITDAEAQAFRDNKDYDNPQLSQAKEIERIYNQVLPEVDGLIKKASHLARIECGKYCKTWDKLHSLYEHRGYVVTLLGRRMRFPDGQRIHKALNGVIQGGAADYNKQKLVELHEAREWTQLLMRVTLHDEVDGDAREPDTLRKVQEVLDAQSFPELKIPIRWDVNEADNWAEAA